MLIDFYQPYQPIISYLNSMFYFFSLFLNKHITRSYSVSYPPVSTTNQVIPLNTITKSINFHLPSSLLNLLYPPKSFYQVLYYLLPYSEGYRS